MNKRRLDRGIMVFIGILLFFSLAMIADASFKTIYNPFTGKLDYYFDINDSTINFSQLTYLGTLGYTNITPCNANEILETVGGAWTCAAKPGGGTGESKWVDNGTYLTPNVSFANSLNLSESGGFIDVVGSLMINGLGLGGFFIGRGNSTGNTTAQIQNLIFGKYIAIGNATGNTSAEIQNLIFGKYIAIGNATGNTTDEIRNQVYGNIFIGWGNQTGNSTTEIRTAVNNTVHLNVSLFTPDIVKSAINVFIGGVALGGLFIGRGNATGNTTDEIRNQIFGNIFIGWGNSTGNTTDQMINANAGRFIDTGNYSSFNDAYVNKTGDDWNQSQHIVPVANTTYNIGNSSEWVSEIYVNETITQTVRIGSGTADWNGTCMLFEVGSSSLAICP